MLTREEFVELVEIRMAAGGLESPIKYLADETLGGWINFFAAMLQSKAHVSMRDLLEANAPYAKRQGIYK